MKSCKTLKNVFLQHQHYFVGAEKRKMRGRDGDGESKRCAQREREKGKR